jgi:hypothetical protein
MRYVILLYIMPIVLLAIGIIQTIYPEKTFMFGRRWMLTDESQLSDTAKVLIRIGGVIIIIISVIVLIQITI